MNVSRRNFLEGLGAMGALAAFPGCTSPCCNCSGIKGKIQLGSAWWFCDHRDGMEEHLKTLGNLGSLGTFIGMLTDSRSFLSYSRHEYFRRILCNMLAESVNDGFFPDDDKILGKIIRNICHDNAAAYFIKG